MPLRALHTRRYQRLRRLLRTLRSDADLTQRELARRLRRTQAWVWKSECGERRVDLAEFCEWCEGCECDVITALRRFIDDKVE